MRAARRAQAFAVALEILIATRRSLAQVSPPPPGANPAATRDPAVGSTSDLGSPLTDVIPPVLLSDPFVPAPEGTKDDVSVVLIVTVNVDGSVRSAKPFETNEPFSTLASTAGLGWRFEPAKRAGKPVPSRIRFEVVFRAPPPPPPSAAPSPSSGPIQRPSPTPPKTDSSYEEVTVRGKQADPSRTVSLTRAEVREIPGTFGDPFRALEIMPGVTPIVSGLPFFFVRGAPPGDVGYFLDGVRVPYLFHVGAGPSVIHPGLIESVDLYPGGYPAQFGRFSGGIVSGETNPPRTDAAHGEYNLRLFDVGALVETPFDGGRGTALLAGRYSYTGLLLSLISPSTSLAYWDYQGRFTFDLTPRDRVGAFVFGGYDYLGQKTATTTTTLFGVNFNRLDLRYDHKINDSGASLRTAVTGGLDYTDIGDGQSARDRMVGMRTELKYPVSHDAVIHAGTDLQVDRYDVVLNTDTSELSPAQEDVAQTFFPSRTDIAFGVRGDAALDLSRRFQMTPGLRVDFYGSEGATAAGVDPRLSTRTVLTDRVRLLSALGIAHQPPAFVIPVPGLAPGGLIGGLQTAVQESMGVEVDLGQGTVGKATIYHNGFFNMSDALSVLAPQSGGCPPGSFPADSLTGDRGGQMGGFGGGGCGKQFAQGTLGADRSGGGGLGAQSASDIQTAQAFETRSNGTAYGFELFIKRKLTKRLGGFLSYTLSRSTRTVNDQTFIATFDRTHVVNAAVAYDLGRKWRAGARVTFYTGLPAANATDTGPSGSRLSPFFRLDLRLEKRWELGKGWWISFVAEWMNVTLSKEAVGTNCTLSGCQEQLIGPITIPSIGIEGGF
jgi:hypothetical protein